MKRNIKLLIAFLVVLMTLCVFAACDSSGDNCDHDFVEVRYEGNCVYGGMKYLECSKCGRTTSEKVPAPGHDIEVIPAVEPTCTTKGSTEGQKCKTCGEYVVTPQDIEPQHKLETLAAVPATCTENGLTEGKYCTVCNKAVVPQMVDYAAHNFKIIVAIEATCTEDGMSEGEECLTCGLVVKEAKTIPAGHTYEYVAPVAETCTTNGHTSGYKCTRCNHVQSGIELIPAAHKSVVVEGKEGYEATCQETGLSPEMVCTVCHTTTATQEIIPVTDHMPQLVEGYEATCTTDGLTDGYVCKTCPKVLVEQEVIPMTNHVAVAVNGYAATCTSVGLSDGEKCRDCGMVMKNQYTILSDGHSFGSDGKCVDCDIAITQDLEYEVEDSSVYARSATRYIVKGLKSGAAPTVVVIPDTYNDCPVVGIKANAFQGKISIEKVIIPKSIVTVGDNAFDGCISLEIIECADFIQSATWGTSWYGDASFKITAILNGGKTPYETYLEAMNNVAHNFTNYTLESSTTAYITYEGNPVPMLSMHTFQQQDGNNFLQWSIEEGVAGYDTVSGYINGKVYMKTQYDSVIYMVPASYEYCLDNFTVSAASVEMGPEDFNNVEFYKDMNGLMHLSIDFCSDTLMELMEQLMSSEGFFDGVPSLTSSVYNYVFDSNGIIQYYDYDVEMADIMSFVGRSEFTNIGNTEISMSVVDGYTEVRVPNCYGYHNIIEVEAIDSTCFAQGRSAYSYCSNCYQAIDHMTPIAPKHTYANGECVDCGDFSDSTLSTGLAYAINSDRTGYIVIGVGECDDTFVKVPSYVYGLPVIQVKDGAFDGSDVESVIYKGQTIWTNK